MKYTINELANSKGVSQPVREALLHMEAELDATNRQVEILSDALAESRRSINALVALARADESEQIAQMIEGAPPLMPFAQNDQGGCLMCGFTPKLAAAAIRARGNT
jgi:hypothetical protein